MPPETSLRPGSVVRAQPGDGEAKRYTEHRRGAAHPQRVDHGHRGGAGDRLVQVRQREPLIALAEQPRRDGQQQEARARREDEADQQQPEQRHPQAGQGAGSRQAAP